MSQFIDYPDRDLLVMDLANKLAGDLREALGHQDRASLVVPGGSTPGPIFDVLCAADLDWERVDVMLSDERWVPDTSERSNTKLLRERLLIERAAAARFVPFIFPIANPKKGLQSSVRAVAMCFRFRFYYLEWGSICILLRSFLMQIGWMKR